MFPLNVVANSLEQMYKIMCQGPEEDEGQQGCAREDFIYPH